MSRYKNLIRDMGLFALGSLGSKLISFLLLPLYTYVLTTEEYGISDLIFTYGQLILPFISLAIFNGLLRYGLMRDVKPENAWRCASRVYWIGSVATVLLTPLLNFIPSVAPYRWFLCAYVISSFAVSNSLIYLKVKDKNKLYALLSILQTLVLVLCNVLLLVVFHFGVQGYLLAYIISNIATAGCAFFMGGMLRDLKVSKYDSSLMKAMILFSLPYILNDVSWWAIHSSNKFLIELLMSASDLGIYTTASKIPSMINVVSSIFSQAWGLSSIKEYDSSNDTSFYSNVFHYFIIFIFGVCIFAVSIIKIFMKYYVSDEFFIAWQYIPLLLLGAVFSAISSFAGSLLGAMKKTQNLMWSTLIAGVANVLVNLICIRLIGLWGAVLGTVAAYLIVSVCRLVSVRKKVKIDYNLKKFIPIALLAAVQALLVSRDFYILITSAVSILLYFAINYKDFKRILTVLKQKIKG